MELCRSGDAPIFFSCLRESKINSVCPINVTKASYPSEEFAKKYKIKGLYEDWELPYFFDSREDWNLATMLFDMRAKSRDLIYKTFVDLNPRLKEIKVINRTKIDVINGAISKFNFDDIQFFAEKWMRASDSAPMVKSAAMRIKEIEVVAKLNLPYTDMPRWIISDKTLDNILRQLDH